MVIIINTVYLQSGPRHSLFLLVSIAVIFWVAEAWARVPGPDVSTSHSQPSPDALQILEPLFEIWTEREMPMVYDSIPALVWNFGSLIIIPGSEGCRFLEIRFAVLTCAIPAVVLEFQSFVHRIILGLLYTSFRRQCSVYTQE
ncbi:hypothetical protein ASPCAL03525 [Aspergillus calidoustus]|uniref:Uncharacterized protein n=1 Tax=Aspergillus calidoustus TaxID=454130 RepID=A0A0U5FS44_ASPCI|nr:hypothetical protein ASPCAL03525 [Aspergillus calidoustus]